MIKFYSGIKAFDFEVEANTSADISLVNGSVCRSADK